MCEASGVAAERLGNFLDRLNEEEEEEDVAVVMDTNDEVQEKEQKKHIGAMIKFFGESAATLLRGLWWAIQIVIRKEKE